MINKPAQTQVPIHELLQNRWSPRAFAKDRLIDDNMIVAMLEAARWSPSCMNEQPWRFVVCAKHQSEQAWQDLLGCLNEKNQIWAQHAPLLLLAVSMNVFSHNDQPNRWANYDTGAACLSLCLQASALGLVSHQMGGFDVETCREKFGIPGNVTLMSVIAVGYQAEADILPEDLRQREQAERSRATVAERFFFGGWG